MYADPDPDHRIIIYLLELILILTVVLNTKINTFHRYSFLKIQHFWLINNTRFIILLEFSIQMSENE